MEQVGVALEGNAGGGFQLFDLDFGIDINDKFSFRMNFDENLKLNLPRWFIVIKTLFFVIGLITSPT